MPEVPYFIAFGDFDGTQLLGILGVVICLAAVTISWLQIMKETNA